MRVLRFHLLVFGLGIVMILAALAWFRVAQARTPASYIAYTASNDTTAIYRMWPDGEHTQLLTDRFLNVLGLAWSPDARQIAFVAQNHTYESYVYVMDADGDNLRQLAPADDAYSGLGVVNWSADGEWIMFMLTFGFSSGTGRVRPDGSEVQVFRSEDALAPLNGQLDGEWVAVDGASVPVQPDDLLRLVSRWSFAKRSPDGAWVALPMSGTGITTGLYRVPATQWNQPENQAELICAVSRHVTSLDWSSDGTHLVYTTTSGTDGSDLFRVRVEDGAVAHLLHDTAYSEMRAGWSPDGRWIVVEARAGLQGHVFRLDANSTGLRALQNVQQLTTNPVLNGQAVWSPPVKHTLRGWSLLLAAGLACMWAGLSLWITRRQRRYAPRAFFRNAFTAWTGMANPTSGPAIMVLMPTSRPATSTSGPPEWPGRMWALTAIHSR